MNNLFDRILRIIEEVQDDEQQMQQILDYLVSEVDLEKYKPINQLPEKYRPVVNEIAQYMDMGMICYLNPETVKLSFIPQELFYDIEGSDDVEEIKKQLDDVHGWQTVEFLDWDNPIVFQPFPSNQSFRIMEKFTHNLPNDENLRPKLINALQNRKPFANFGRIIDNSDLREDWFEFKREYLDNLVAEDLLMELENLKEDNNEI
ncbi:MAG: hypothetical protein GX857_02070 [Bacteroidales bacterium]|nr:hypothetical protein [Bacteroidales bacterium]